MTVSPARSLVFGIARRAPFSEYSKVIIEHLNPVRICKMIFTYHRRENDTSADNFLDDVICHYGRVIIRTVFLFTTSQSTYCEAVSLTRLVKAENVSPYHGILINTGMGNPTVTSIVALGK